MNKNIMKIGEQVPSPTNELESLSANSVTNKIT